MLGKNAFLFHIYEVKRTEEQIQAKGKNSVWSPCSYVVSYGCLGNFILCWVIRDGCHFCFGKAVLTPMLQSRPCGT